MTMAITKQDNYQTNLSNPLYNKMAGGFGQASNNMAQVYLSSKLEFLTLEKNCIKLWILDQGTIELKKKINIKQMLKNCILSEITGFMLVLGDNGKLLVLSGIY